MNVFNQFVRENNFSSVEADEVISNAFDILKERHQELDLSYYEDGVWITNYGDFTEEDKESMENNLTKELLEIADTLC